MKRWEHYVSCCYLVILHCNTNRKLVVSISRNIRNKMLEQFVKPDIILISLNISGPLFTFGKHKYVAYIKYVFRVKGVEKGSSKEGKPMPSSYP